MDRRQEGKIPRALKYKGIYVSIPQGLGGASQRKSNSKFPRLVHRPIFLLTLPSGGHMFLFTPRTSEISQSLLCIIFSTEERSPQHTLAY